MIYKKKLHKLKYYYATPTPSENYLNNFYSNIYFKKKTTHTFSKKYSNIELKNNSFQQLALEREFALLFLI